MEAVVLLGAATSMSLLALILITGSLCRRALRNGGNFEAEVRALSLSFRLRASRNGGPDRS